VKCIGGPRTIQKLTLVSLTFKCNTFVLILNQANSLRSFTHLTDAMSDHNLWRHFSRQDQLGLLQIYIRPQRVLSTCIWPLSVFSPDLSCQVVRDCFRLKLACCLNEMNCVWGEIISTMRQIWMQWRERIVAGFCKA
jgi:hypothetical protein